MPRQRPREGNTRSTSELRQNIRENGFPDLDSLPVPIGMTAGVYADTRWYQEVVHDKRPVTRDLTALKEEYAAKICKDPACAVVLFRQKYQQRIPLAIDKDLIAVSAAIAHVFCIEASKHAMECVVTIPGGSQVPLVECLYDALYEVIIEDNFLLEFPVYTTDIMSVMASIRKRPLQIPQGRIILASAMRRGLTLWKALWDNHRCLARDETIEMLLKPLPQSIAELALEFFTHGTVREECREARSAESRLPHLALLCWFYAPAEDDISRMALTAATHLVTHSIYKPHLTADQKLALIDCAVVNTIGPANFIKRLVLELQKPNAIQGDNLLMTVRAMSGFLTHPAFEKLFVPSGIYKALTITLAQFEHI